MVSFGPYPVLDLHLEGAKVVWNKYSHRIYKVESRAETMGEMLQRHAQLANGGQPVCGIPKNVFLLPSSNNPPLVAC